MGHYYSQEGQPRYSITAKAGHERPSTLADARKFGWVPSVTEVLGVLAKPALMTWMVRQGIEAAMADSRASLGKDDRIAAILKDSQTAARESAEEGSRIHDALECATQGRPYPDEYHPHVAAVQEELRRLFPGVTDWVAEQSFACPAGYGGKVDLYSPSEAIVVDYKSKAGDFSDGKRLAYDQHYQLAAYREGLGLPGGRAANVFASRTHPGKAASYVWSEADMAQGVRVFHAVLEVWKLLKGYDGAFPAQGDV